MRKASARYHNVDLFRFLGWQGGKVFCPAFERLAHLGGVPSAVIHYRTGRAMHTRCVGHHPMVGRRLPFSLRTSQRNRNELRETTANKTWRKHLPQQ